MGNYAVHYSGFPMIADSNARLCVEQERRARRRRILFSVAQFMKHSLPLEGGGILPAVHHALNPK